MRQVPRPVGLPAAYTPGASSTSALTLRVRSQTLSASPSSAYTPSAERASPRKCPVHRLPSAPRASASTYWLRSRPQRCGAVGAPAESLISDQVVPWSQDSLMPSAVPTYTVSPRVTMPFGATYCHSGPSCLSSQLVQVLPPSVDRPHPFPTVPYQISPFGPNPKAFTKSKEIVRAVESLECFSCSQLPAPLRSTKIPCP